MSNEQLTERRPKKTCRNVPIKLIKRNVWAQSEYFSLKDVAPLPEFVSIHAIINEQNEFSIKVVKVNKKPATAVIELCVAKRDWVIKEFEHWTEECCFDNAPMPQHYVNCKRCSRTFQGKKCKFCGYNLRVLCTITWYGFHDEDYNTDLSVDLNEYLRLTRNKFSDVIVKVRDTEFPAHKVILAARSSVFETMLTINMRERRDDCITLPEELDVYVVEGFIKFLYEGKLGIPETDVETHILILQMAHVYEINALKNLCEEILSNNLNTDTVVKVLEIADLYKSSILKERAISFILIHRAEVILSRSFIDLYQKSPDLTTEIIKKLDLIC